MLRRNIIVCLLSLLIHYSIAAQDCKSGTAKLILTGVSGGPQCFSNEVATLWPYLTVTIPEDCNYLLEGLRGGKYTYPTTFAKVTYPTRDGQNRPFTDTHTSHSNTGFNSWFDWSGGTNTSRSTASASDFDSFTYSWAATGLLQIKDFTYYDVASSAFAFRRTGPSSLEMTLKPEGCNYSYRIVSGSIGGLTVTACKPGSGVDCPQGSCPSGKYRQTLEGSEGYVCGLCPAGTQWSNAYSGSCTPCAAGTIASAVGSTQCTGCPQGQVTRSNRTSCGACDTLPFPPSNSVFLGGQACQNYVCPNHTLATINNDCLGAYNGRLCVVKSAGSGTAGTCPPEAIKGDAAIGGAILMLDLPTSDLSNPVCSKGPSALTKWLSTKPSWMGFDFSTTNNSYYNSHPRVDWQVLSPVGDQPKLDSYHYCGVSRHGGGPPFVGLTAQASVLDTTAINFVSLPNSQGWQVIATKGPGQDVVKTLWFPDGQSADCSSYTSLGVRDRAQGKLAEGTCTLSFKVVAGSILGASGKGSCPAATLSVKQPDGTTSCLACPLGSAVMNGKCVGCSGSSYQDEFGGVGCKTCKGTTDNAASFGAGGNTYCYTNM